MVVAVEGHTPAATAAGATPSTPRDLGSKIRVSVGKGSPFLTAEEVSQGVVRVPVAYLPDAMVSTPGANQEDETKLSFDHAGLEAAAESKEDTGDTHVPMKLLDLVNDPMCLRSPPLMAVTPRPMDLHLVPDMGPGMEAAAIVVVEEDADEEDAGAVIRRMRSLQTLLDHARPGTFVALDIDDTLCCNLHHPCFLMTDPGLEAFRHALSASSETFEVKNKKMRALQAALREKKLVEGELTAHVVRALQDRGCFVFGLTARYAEMAAMTQKVLGELGIDLSAKAPFPPMLLQDPVTHAVCTGGVVYTNAGDKGLVLNRFLENVVFRDVLNAPPDANAFTPPVPIPPELLFVDDRRQNAECVAGGLPVLDRLGIKLTCYHFIAPMTLSLLHIDDEQMADGAEAGGTMAPHKPHQLLPGETKLDKEVMRIQVTHFISHAVVLGNKEAEAMLPAKHKTFTPRLPTRSMVLTPVGRSLSDGARNGQWEGGVPKSSILLDFGATSASSAGSCTQGTSVLSCSGPSAPTTAGGLGVTKDYAAVAAEQKTSPGTKQNRPHVEAVYGVPPRAGKRARRGTKTRWVKAF